MSGKKKPLEALLRINIEEEARKLALDDLPAVQAAISAQRTLIGSDSYLGPEARRELRRTLERAISIIESRGGQIEVEGEDRYRARRVAIRAARNAAIRAEREAAIRAAYQDASALDEVSAGKEERSEAHRIWRIFFTSELKSAAGVASGLFVYIALSSIVLSVVNPRLTPFSPPAPFLSLVLPISNPLMIIPWLLGFILVGLFEGKWWLVPGMKSGAEYGTAYVFSVFALFSSYLVWIYLGGSGGFEFFLAMVVWPLMLLFLSVFDLVWLLDLIALVTLLFIGIHLGVRTREAIQGRMT